MEFTSSGYDGKWVIHPAQVHTAIGAFTPSASAVAARRVIRNVTGG